MNVETNRPPDRPVCKHGHPVGMAHGCQKCIQEGLDIRDKVGPLVDDFWDHKGSHDLEWLMVRAYRMGMEHEQGAQKGQDNDQACQNH